MTRPFSDLPDMLSDTVEAARKGQRRGVQQAALYVTTEIRKNIRIATGGDMWMSGVGRRGARVGAGYDIKGTVNPTAFIKAKGPLHLLERDTSPHVIPRKRRYGRKRYAAFGGNVYSWVQHPGTRGKHPFERGWKTARAKTPEIFQKEIHDAVKKVW